MAKCRICTPEWYEYGQPDTKLSKKPVDFGGGSISWEEYSEKLFKNVRLLGHPRTCCSAFKIGSTL
jgi:hypothetical protein